MRAWLFAPLLALAACGASPKPPVATHTAAPAHASTPPPLRSFVLLKSTAIVRTAPNETSQPLQLFASDDEARQATQDDPNPVFRVVAERPPFVEVETSFDAEHFCHDGLLGVASYRLRFFVRRDDFALVTARAVDVDYPDGSGVTLSAGVTLRDVDGKIEANPSGQWFETPLDAAAIGDSFDPSPPFPNAADVFGTLSATPKHGVRFAGELFPAFPSTHRPAWSESVEVDSVTKTPDGKLVAVVVERCARYRVVVDPSDVDEEIAGVGGLGMMGTMGGGFDVRRGATIYWKNGQIAGSTREELVDVQGAVKSGPDRWCWNVALRVGGGPTIGVCVGEKDVY